MEKASEKIFVQLPSARWIGRTWDEKPLVEGDNPNWKNATNIEYIRKDAILEWLKPPLSEESRAKFDKMWVQGWDTMREKLIERLDE